MLHKAWNIKGEMPYCFPRLSIKFQGHMGHNITDFVPNWAFQDYRPVAAFKSLRFALFIQISNFVRRHGVHEIWEKLSTAKKLDWCRIKDKWAKFSVAFIEYNLNGLSKYSIIVFMSTTSLINKTLHNQTILWLQSIKYIKLQCDIDNQIITWYILWLTPYFRI